jgi:ELWxxDGT repeat protein
VISRRRLATAESVNIINRTLKINAAVGGNDLEDFYRFRLGQRSSFSLYLRNLDEDANVALLDRKGNVIRQSTRPGSSAETIVCRRLRSGVYYVRVYRRGNEGTSYTLGLTASPIGGEPPLPTPRDNATQVSDINRGEVGSNPAELVNFNGRLFFAASTDDDGIELWQSDGTSDNTTQVRNINSGSASSISIGSRNNALVVVSNVLYFAADGGTNDGVELWRSDGTRDGTVQVADINPDGNSNPTDLVNFNGILYFAADGGTNDGKELWRSDGTSDGTFQVANINPDGGSNPTELTVVGNRLFFVATDGDSTELWSSDGTRGNTDQVEDINRDESFNPTDLVNFNDTLYFAANGDDDDGRGLWRLDSTSNNAVQVDRGSESSNPSGLTVSGNFLYFAATTTADGTELWRSDGNTIRQVRDINNEGSASSNLTDLIDVNGTLYFVATDDDGRQIWRSDGTDQGTRQVTNGREDFQPSELALVGNNLFFSANGLGDGRELWRIPI